MSILKKTNDEKEANTVKTIINDNFMLGSATAAELYFRYAEKAPIIDYHCHLDPKLIASDHRFADLGELMLGGDHYKWRAMRSFGIDEALITGSAPNRDKFRAYAEMLEWAIGNPLYAWTHLELKRYFDIDESLTAKSADKIFDICTEKLQEPGFTAKGLISRSNVDTLCTTDDPKDDLHSHGEIAASGFATKVLPAFRPDKAINVHKDTFFDYVASTGVETYSGLQAWLRSRIEYFHSKGCRLADHGLDFIPFRKGDAEKVFDKAMKKMPVTPEEAEIFMTDMLLLCGREYARLGWTMQLHFGALRNNNSVMMAKLGPDTGFDAIADTSPAAALSALLDQLEGEDKLPKTIIYSLNGKDNYAIAALMGCFQKAPFRSKIQLGSGWWFNDQRDGMEAQLKALANLGLLGCFIGMLTDSRSFVSYPRHEYFRRILCSLLGSWVEGGEYPGDTDMLGKIVYGISYGNAREYFGF